MFLAGNFQVLNKSVEDFHQMKDAEYIKTWLISHQTVLVFLCIYLCNTMASHKQNEEKEFLWLREF